MRGAISFAALVACGGSEAQLDPPAPEPAWREAFDTSDAGSLSGVWSSAPDDVFVVGGDNDGAEIYHYDGASWSGTTLPSVPLLVWVHGFGPDDVYAVGVAGGMVHYDGASWSAIETGTDKDLWGVFGFEPGDMWIVGGDPFEGDPIILHYDGATFTPTLVPESERPADAHALFKVWGIDGAVHAVGQQGLILSRDGDGWTRADAGKNADEDFVSLWGSSADRIVAVGGRTGARIAIYDGTSWTTRTPDDSGLNGVHMSAPDQAIVGGLVGLAGRYVLSTGELIREADGLTHIDIHSVWGVGDGTHYAVGGSFAEPHRGVALVRRIADTP